MTKVLARLNPHLPAALRGPSMLQRARKLSWIGILGVTAGAIAAVACMIHMAATCPIVLYVLGIAAALYAYAAKHM